MFLFAHYLAFFVLCSLRFSKSSSNYVDKPSTRLVVYRERKENLDESLNSAAARKNSSNLLNSKNAICFLVEYSFFFQSF